MARARMRCAGCACGCPTIASRIIPPASVQDSVIVATPHTITSVPVQIAVSPNLPTGAFSTLLGVQVLLTQSPIPGVTIEHAAPETRRAIKVRAD